MIEMLPNEEDSKQCVLGSPVTETAILGVPQAPSHPSLWVWESHMGVYFMFCNKSNTPKNHMTIFFLPPNPSRQLEENICKHMPQP